MNFNTVIIELSIEKTQTGKDNYNEQYKNGIHLSERA